MLRRIIIIIVIGMTILITSAIIGWYLLGGEQKARQMLIGYLQPIISPTLTAESLSFNTHHATLKMISVDLSPSVSFHITAIQVEFSLLQLLLNRGELTGVLSEVKIVEPHLRIYPSPEHNSNSSPPIRTVLPPGVKLWPIGDILHFHSNRFRNWISLGD
ncbi:MAG: hypothetical protein P9M15_06530 [Candidatus Electryoneaceae bacterium]|nr:hypothetical protein [Candidatus Electryoneaceae bacterium]